LLKELGRRRNCIGMVGKMIKLLKIFLITFLLIYMAISVISCRTLLLEQQTKRETKKWEGSDCRSLLRHYGKPYIIDEVKNGEIWTYYTYYSEYGTVFLRPGSRYIPPSYEITWQKFWINYEGIIVYSERGRGFPAPSTQILW